MNNTDHTHKRWDCRPQVLICCIAGALALLHTDSKAADAFQIERITYTNGYVMIEFSDSRLLSDPGLAYALEYSDTVGAPDSWRHMYSLGATFSSLDKQTRMVVLPAPGNCGFYRLGLDSDADGLSDGMEVTRLGTNPYIPDTDGDGYSDIIEVANGTLPTNAQSCPLRGVQPGVQFSAPTSQALEGAGTIFVPVEFTTLYSGLLFYSVSAMSTASNGADFRVAQPGILRVNGSTAAIPVEIQDDLEVEDIEAIVLELHDDAAGTYHVGAFPTHTILLMDNDATWSGLLQSSAGETSFRLCVIRSNANVTATLVPGPKSDTNHLGGQIIPLPLPGQNGWPVTNLLLTATQFRGVSVPMPAGAARLLGNAPIGRTLAFSAIPPAPGETNVAYLSKTNAALGGLMLAGRYVETLSPAEPAASSLSFTNQGSFFLTREVPVMTPLETPTMPAQP